MKKSCIQELFPELELKAGDTINGKGERLFSKDIFQGMSFVQDHSGIFVVCIIKRANMYEKLKKLMDKNTAAYEKRQREIDKLMESEK